MFTPAAILWRFCLVQTHADLRIGMLVRWHGEGLSDEDVDELGIVTKLPGENWRGHYEIAWAITKDTTNHSPDMIEESFYQGQLEIVQ